MALNNQNIIQNEKIQDNPNEEHKSLYKDESYDKVSDIGIINEIKKAVLLNKDEPVKPINLDWVKEKLK